jgi:hypothetical protein
MPATARSFESGCVIFISNQACVWTFKTQQSAIVESNNKTGLFGKPIPNGKSWRAFGVINHRDDGTHLIVVNHAMPTRTRDASLY